VDSSVQTESGSCKPETKEKSSQTEDSEYFKEPFVSDMKALCLLYNRIVQKEQIIKESIELLNYVQVFCYLFTRLTFCLTPAL
jgi:hypothetical protein